MRALLGPLWCLLCILFVIRVAPCAFPEGCKALQVAWLSTIGLVNAPNGVRLWVNGHACWSAGQRWERRSLLEEDLKEFFQLGVVWTRRRALLAGFWCASVVARWVQHSTRLGHVMEGWLCRSVTPIGRLCYLSADSKFSHSAAGLCLLESLFIVLPCRGTYGYDARQTVSFCSLCTHAFRTLPGPFLFLSFCDCLQTTHV